MINLTNYQIAEAFGKTLSLIYKDKISELDEELSPIYTHLAKLQIPQIHEFHRQFAKQTIPSWAKEKIHSIEHINRIKELYKKMKKTPAIEKYELDIQKAKSILISSLYNFENRKKDMVSCPFHPDNSPSMKLNKNNTVKCFSCGFFGDSITVFMKLNNIKFREAILEMTK